MVLYYETKNELLHYGIKGMKWGVRKKHYHSTGDKTHVSDAIELVKKGKDILGFF